MQSASHLGVRSGEFLNRASVQTDGLLDAGRRRDDSGQLRTETHAGEYRRNRRRSLLDSLIVRNTLCRNFFAR